MFGLCGVGSIPTCKLHNRLECVTSHLSLPFSNPEIYDLQCRWFQNVDNGEYLFKLQYNYINTYFN